MKLKLLLGNKNYSSWSLRAWIALAHSGADFDVDVVPLYQSESEGFLAASSPSRLVPVLYIDGAPVWDSIAILETVAELFPDSGLLPDDFKARALNRSVSAEMHSGFFALRNHLPMNCRQTITLKAIPLEVQADIERVVQIWAMCREKYAANGPWLFGRYTLADAMYAPVVSRFVSYGIELPSFAQVYVDTTITDPLLVQWYEEAVREPWTIADSDKPFLE